MEISEICQRAANRIERSRNVLLGKLEAFDCPAARSAQADNLTAFETPSF